MTIFLKLHTPQGNKPVHIAVDQLAYFHAQESRPGEPLGETVLAFHGNTYLHVVETPDEIFEKLKKAGVVRHD
jgi:hypothetical protein